MAAPNGEDLEHALVHVPDAAVALVVDEQRQEVLMLHRHRWVIDREGFELFGGIEPGEQSAETALREAKSTRSHGAPSWTVPLPCTVHRILPLSGTDTPASC